MQANPPPGTPPSPFPPHFKAPGRTASEDRVVASNKAVVELYQILIFVQGIKPRAWGMAGRVFYTTDLYPQASHFIWSL